MLALDKTELATLLTSLVLGGGRAQQSIKRSSSSGSVKGYGSTAVDGIATAPSAVELRLP